MIKTEGKRNVDWRNKNKIGKHQSGINKKFRNLSDINC